MTQSDHDFIQLIRMAMGIKCDTLAGIDWDAMWKFARSNHLETIFQMAATYFDDIPPTIQEKARQEYDKMLGRTMLQEHCLEKVENVLKQAGIPYALQKGAILRNDYPQKTMRFMTDIDFYIRTEDRKKIKKAMEQAGIPFSDTESGDEQYCMIGEVGIEFHGRLLYRRSRFGIENYPCWEMVDEERNRLTEEGYALNLIGHTVYDLSRGGPGIRQILDLWVYKHLHSGQPDWEKVKEWLQKDGIYDVAMNLMDLSDFVFGEGQRTELLDEMADYILADVLMHDMKRESLSELALTGNRGQAAIKHFFRGKAEYENRYPWLMKYPFLLPVAWMLRMWNSLNRHKREIKAWKKNLIGFTKEEIKYQRDRLSRFGL